MKKLISIISALTTSVIFFTIFSCEKPLNSISKSTSIDMVEARKIVDSIDNQFTKYFYEGDSLSLYNMYAKGASFGNLKGEDILKSWGSQIRNSIKEDARNFLFTPIFLNTDNEFLFEVGKYEFKDNNGNLKGEGKYLMVLKQENGKWKIYHDVGL